MKQRGKWRIRYDTKRSGMEWNEMRNDERQTDRSSCSDLAKTSQKKEKAIERMGIAERELVKERKSQ